MDKEAVNELLVVLRMHQNVLHELVSELRSSLEETQTWRVQDTETVLAKSEAMLDQIAKYIAGQAESPVHISVQSEESIAAFFRK